MKKFLRKNVNYFYYIAWWQALAAVVGSLYFSEIKQFPPCVLCWWQRILMYPLALMIPIGIMSKDRKMLPRYVLALSVPGILVAFYHNLLYYGVVPEALAPCVAGISCTTKFVEFFGFISIPFLSLVSFLVVTGCMILTIKFSKGGKH